MQIPEIFKNTIEDIFYDKDIEIWRTGTLVDDEGSITETKTEKKETFQGNFQFKTREKIKQEYGEEVIADAVITCRRTLAKEKDILIYLRNRTNYELSQYKHGELASMTHEELSKYQYEFEIVSVIPSDSHITILAKGVFNNV